MTVTLSRASVTFPPSLYGLRIHVIVVKVAAITLQVVLVPITTVVVLLGHEHGPES